VKKGLRPGRGRSNASRQAILASTFALLEEDGFVRLTIEGVAARAGVGKTTIYRWWPSKGVLAVEAFLSAVTPAITFPHGASPRDNLRSQMLALAALYRGPMGRFAREMIGASQHDPEARRAFVDGFLAPRRLAAHVVFQRGVAAGEFTARSDPDLAIDALYGPIYYRLLASGALIDDAFVNGIADLVLSSLTS
jgi:AcrR family transcriptional regulator